MLRILLLFSFLTPGYAADRAATENADVSVFDKLGNGIMSFFNDLMNSVKALIQRVKALFQKNRSDGVALVLPKDGAVTGVQVTAPVNMGIPTGNSNYYIADRGDGTWSYNGPFVYAEGWLRQTPNTRRHRICNLQPFCPKPAADGDQLPGLYWFDLKIQKDKR